MGLKGIRKFLYVAAIMLLFTPILDLAFTLNTLSPNERSILAILGLLLFAITEALRNIEQRLATLESANK